MTSNDVSQTWIPGYKKNRARFARRARRTVYRARGPYSHPGTKKSGSSRLRSWSLVVAGGRSLESFRESRRALTSAWLVFREPGRAQGDHPTGMTPAPTGKTGHMTGKACATIGTWLPGGGGGGSVMAPRNVAKYQEKRGLQASWRFAKVCGYSPNRQSAPSVRSVSPLRQSARCVWSFRVWMFRAPLRVALREC